MREMGVYNRNINADPCKWNREGSKEDGLERRT